MSLFEQVNKDIKQAMLNKEKEKLEALRAIKAAFTANVWVKPKKYTRGASAVPINPTDRISLRLAPLILTGFPMSKI